MSNEEFKLPIVYPSLIYGKVRFQHLGAEDTHQPDFDFDLNIENRDLVVKSTNNQRVVTTFRDPETGLIVTNIPNVHNNRLNQVLVNSKFNHAVAKIILNKWVMKYNALKTARDKDKDEYNKHYRDLSLLDRAMTERIKNPSVMAEKLIKKLRLVEPHTDFGINQKLIFNDSDVELDSYNTDKLPYDNPENIENDSDGQAKLAEFLRVFMDDDNIRVFLWYFGALLSNEDMRRISKMLVVSSAKGGNGKNTLIEAVANALFTPKYYDVKPSLDIYFDKQNRFSMNQLIPLHLTIFGEAEWSQGYNPTYDFAGYNLDGFKSLISDGVFVSEAKFKGASNNLAPNTGFIALTNHLPNVASDKQALNRRLLPLILKSSSMAEKGTQLHLRDRQDVFAYLEKLRAQLAKMCYDYYQSHPLEFRGSEYSRADAVRQVQENNQEYNQAQENKFKTVKETAKNNPGKALKLLTEKTGVNFDRIADLAAKAQDAEHADFGGKILHWDMRAEKPTLYLNSAKNVLSTATDNSDARDILISVFGQPIKKFGMHVIAIK